MKFIEKLLSKNSSEKAVDIGKHGELIAEKILKKQGYKIVERNFNTRFGEIDIIAQDGEYICFVEVRMRKTDIYGSPAETIDKYKREKIVRTARIYVQKYSLHDAPLRFDAVAIVGNLREYKYEVIKNAFEL